MKEENILSIDTGTAHTGIARLVNGRYADSRVISYSDIILADKTGFYTPASKRTEAREQRRHYNYKRMRSIDLIAYLIEHRMFPNVSKRELNLWKNEKKAPYKILDKFFSTFNPYKVRVELATKALDMTQQNNLYKFGCAMLSLSHNRGFDFADGFYNDDDSEDDEFETETKKDSKESDSNNHEACKASAKSLEAELRKRGYKYVSQLALEIIATGERYRTKYKASRELIKKEFDAICDMQGIEPRMRRFLNHLVFDNPRVRGVSSAMRANCKFYKTKKVCYDSHPAFEELRMMQFIRNLKVVDTANSESRSLTSDEEQIAIEQFYSYKDTFKISTLKRKIKVAKLNYDDDVDISACTFSVSVANIICDCNDNPVEWKSIAAQRLTKTLGRNISEDEAADIVWHECYNARKEHRDSSRFFEHKLLTDNYDADSIKITNSPARLCAEACRQILKMMMKYGLNYAHAVKMVKIPEVIRQNTTGNVADVITEARLEKVADVMKDFVYTPGITIMDVLADTLNSFSLNKRITASQLSKLLWNHSDAEKYPVVKKDGVRILPPLSAEVCSPGVRKIISNIVPELNRMIINGDIDRNTHVIIESGRQDFTVNEKTALKKIKERNEKRNIDAKEKILKLKPDPNVKLDKLIEMYILLEETGWENIWEGGKISKKDLSTLYKMYDTDHTIAQATGGFNIKENMTVCTKYFNQNVKGSTFPGLMPNINEVMERVDRIYGSKVRELEESIKKNKKVAKHIEDKEKKDRLIVNRLVMQHDLDYFKEKIRSFGVTEISDICPKTRGSVNDYVIKKLRNLLKSYFYSVDYDLASNMSEARDRWEIAKTRDFASNHAEDAYIHACIQYYGLTKKKPYTEMMDDINTLRKECINMYQPKKPFSRRGYGKSLHEDTQLSFPLDGDKMTKRKQIKDITIANVDAIVDKTLRELVRNALINEVEPRDWNGKKIRHVRVVSSFKKKNVVKIPVKNNASEKEQRNYRYYASDGPAYAGYYENNSFIPISAIDDAHGISVPEYKIVKKKKYKLKCILRVNDNVVVFDDDEQQKDPSKMSREELQKRLYYVKQIEMDGPVKLENNNIGNAKTTSSDNKEKSELKSIMLSNVPFIRKSNINLIKLDDRFKI